MSTYDSAVAYLDAEVHQRCDYDIYRGMRDIVDEMEAENAKLRELVWTLANCAAGHGCDFCPINGGYGYVGERDMCDSVHARMVELGIEVGDDA